MRIRLNHPAVLKLVSLLIAWLLRLWLATLEIKFALDERGALPRPARPTLYLFWHEMLLLPAYTHARQGIAVLVSRHHDGELIAQVVRMLGGRTLRGSTRRGGATAVREMMRRARAGHVAITPDGPRGPRRVLQGGAVYLASRAGMPVVPVGMAFESPWRAPSWDRMALPRPFSRARCVFGREIEVPAGATREQIESWRRRVQDAMDDVQARAEALAAPGGDGHARLLTLRQVQGREE